MHYPECVLKLVHDHYSLLNLLGPKITMELGFEEMEKKEERTRRHNRDLTLKYGLRDSESDSSVDLDLTAQEDENTFIRGTVLVFLPGLQEIKT